jgi:hypothetical protein
MAAANAHVPVIMRSAIVACVAGDNFLTPTIVITGEPQPSIFAPIEIRN